MSENSLVCRVVQTFAKAFAFRLNGQIVQDLLDSAPQEASHSLTPPVTRFLGHMNDARTAAAEAKGAGRGVRASLIRATDELTCAAAVGDPQSVG